MLDLNLDARRHRSEWVAVGNDIYSSVLALRSNKRRVVSHASKQHGDQVLKFVRIFRGDLLLQPVDRQLFDLVNRRLLALLSTYSYVLFLRLVGRCVLFLPFAIGEMR